jgi:hypothetical protein
MDNADRGNAQIVRAHADALVTPLKIEGVCLSDYPQSPTQNLFDHHKGHGLFVGRNGDDAGNECGITQENFHQYVNVEGDHTYGSAPRMR